jgi:hypothetical protein
MLALTFKIVGKESLKRIKVDFCYEKPWHYLRSYTQFILAFINLITVKGLFFDFGWRPRHVLYVHKQIQTGHGPNADQ